MTEIIVKVEVVQAAGLLIKGYGSKAKGECFEIPHHWRSRV